MNKQLDTLYQQGRYYEAASFSKQVLPVIENLIAQSNQPSEEIAQSLRMLAKINKRTANYEKAEKFFEECIAIRSKRLGADHPMVASSLEDLSRFYKDIGSYKKAEVTYRRAIKIWEKGLNRNDLLIAKKTFNLALFYRDIGDYINAESLFKKSLEIREGQFGRDSPEIAADLYSISFLYFFRKDYDKCIPLFEKANSLFRKAINDKSRAIVRNTAIAFIRGYVWLLLKLLDQGRYTVAKQVFDALTPIAEEWYKGEDIKLAHAELAAASIYSDFGYYAKAKSLFEHSVQIMESKLGPNHPDLALGLNNLALLYIKLAQYDEAKELLERSVVIRKKALGPDHPDVAQSLTNIGNLYSTLGEYTKARETLERALMIQRKTLGLDHPDVAICLNRIASIHCDLKEFSIAERLYREAMRINEMSFGTNHPSLFKPLNDLALIKLDQGDYTTSKGLLLRSLEISQRAYGLQHPNVSNLLSNLATLKACMKDFDTAYFASRKAAEIDNRIIRQTLDFSSEAKEINFLSTKELNLHFLLSLTAQRPPLWKTSKDSFNMWLSRKGLILETRKRFQEALSYSDDPRTVKISQELQWVRNQTARLTFADYEEQKSVACKRNMTILKKKQTELEAELSRLSQAFALSRKIAKADCEKVAKALPANTVLIDFARVEMFDFSAKQKEKQWKPAHYLAFILHAGDGNKVGMIDLGNAGEIDMAISQCKKKISLMDEESVKSSRKLYRLIFEPTRKQLGDVREIFISPDGNLNLIPFEVFKGPEGRYLIEDYTFNYLAASRDVIGFGQIRDQGGKALLMGDPDFDLNDAEKKAILSKRNGAKGVQVASAGRSQEMSELHFKRLPGSREEVMAIQKLTGEQDKSEIYLGRNALEEVLKENRSPRILHLATHGFFLKDQELPDPPSDQSGMRSFFFTGPAKPRNRNQRIENPMLRSGFALAGANRAVQLTDDQMEDGIVTSEEILGLKLRGTDMVVLSACNTGLGDVKAGEGVFGLRRAFAQAGAKSLVMSMWDVPDKETRELMVAFYRNITSGEMNRCQALRAAALKEMKVVKKRYGHAYPLCWGGFVLVGDPGQLSKNTGAK